LGYLIAPRFKKGIFDWPCIEEEMNAINMMLYMKYKYNISGGAYHEVTQICKALLGIIN